MLKSLLLIVVVRVMMSVSSLTRNISNICDLRFLHRKASYNCYVKNLVIK